MNRFKGDPRLWSEEERRNSNKGGGSRELGLLWTGFGAAFTALTKPVRGLLRTWLRGRRLRKIREYVWEKPD